MRAERREDVGREPTLVGVREPRAEVLERDPGDVFRLAVGVVLDGEVSGHRLEQKMVHGLVDATPVAREPVVDDAEPRADRTRDAGLLRDLADGRLLGGLVALEVTLGEAPLETASTVASGDDGGVRDAVDHRHDEAAGRGLLDDREL